MKPTNRGCTIFGIAILVMIALVLWVYYSAHAEDEQRLYLPNVAKFPVTPRPPVRAYPEGGELPGGMMTIVVDAPECSSVWAEIGITWPLDTYPPSIENPECIDGLAVVTLRFYGPVRFEYIGVTIYRYPYSWPERVELWGLWEVK